MRKADRIPPPVMRRLRRHYYGQITHIDYQLGRLLGELKRLGLYDNTVIVVTSDHGEHLGDHRLFAKSSFLESSARVPIILRLPASHDIHNKRSDAPVLTADIAPTLLELAGLTPAPEMDGLSLLKQPERRVIFGETSESVFATDGAFKYVYYFEGGIEHLFHTAEDPDDLRNLAGEPACARRQDQLKSQLIAYLGRNRRPGVADGALRSLEGELDFDALRARNSAAWRGPLRYGQGYDS